MNKTLVTRLGKLETSTPSASPIIVYARWDETNAEALEAALPDGPPPGISVYIPTERMSVEEWLRFVKCGRDPEWDRARHPRDGFFPGMEDALRIPVANRSRRRQ